MIVISNVCLQLTLLIEILTCLRFISSPLLRLVVDCLDSISVPCPPSSRLKHINVTSIKEMFHVRDRPLQTKEASLQLWQLEVG